MALLRRLRNPGGALTLRLGLRASLPLLHLLVMLAPGGCAPEPGEASDPELRQALGLDDVLVIHRIDLGGRGAQEHVVPARLEVSVGDIVQFVSVDRRVHTIEFGGEALGDSARAFLERTRQDTSPPLLDRGSRFVVSFDSAPPGNYPFTSTGHGTPTPGLIVVRSEDARP